MRGTENTITMLGEQMEVFIGAGCLSEYIIGTSNYMIFMVLGNIHALLFCL